jgi:hypothetical protein
LEYLGEIWCVAEKKNILASDFVFRTGKESIGLVQRKIHPRTLFRIKNVLAHTTIPYKQKVF